MSKKYFKVLPVAGAVSLAILSTAASAATVDFHGYARSGIGASGAGGNQVAFQAAGAATKYRLGNETDTYGEIGLSSDLFDNGEQTFRFNSLMAFGIDQENDWEGTEPAFREFNVEAKGVFGFAPEATLWAGKRYYKRADVHMSDFYYLHAAGPGAGIENIDLGFGDFSFAWLRSTSSIDYYTSEQNALDRQNEKTYKLSQNILDFRLEGIETNHNGNLALIAHYASGSPTTDFEGGWAADGFDQDGNSQAKTVDGMSKSDMDKSGYMLTAEHTQGDFFGGFNKFVVQYARGSMTRDALGTNGAGVSALSSDNLSGNSLTRILNHGTVSLTDDIDMMYQGMYSHMSYNESGKKSQNWISAGVRPMYYWNDIMSTAVEVGFDNVTNAIDGDKTSRLTKVTLAQQWSAGRGVWARPQIRVFGTYATWNDDSKGQIGGEAYADDTNGFTVGVQMEAWW